MLSSEKFNNYSIQNAQIKSNSQSTTSKPPVLADMNSQTSSNMENSVEYLQLNAKKNDSFSYDLNKM